jgi:hypothetical protein
MNYKLVIYHLYALLNFISANQQPLKDGAQAAIFKGPVRTAL